MLLKSSEPVGHRYPHSWSLLLGAGLLGLSVMASGAAPVPDQGKKDESKKEEARKEQPKPDVQKPGKRDILIDPFGDLDKLFENLPGFDNDQLKQMREEMKRTRVEMRRVNEEMRKALERAGQGGFPGGLPGMGGIIGGIGGQLELPRGAGSGRVARNQEGRLGVQIEQPGDTLIDQLDLPRGQGLVLEDVLPDSAARKAGLKAHDILLEIDGKAVPSNVADFIKQLNGIKAKTPVDVMVLRKGKKETLKGLSLPEARAEARPVGGQGGIRFQFPNVFPNAGNGGAGGDGGQPGQPGQPGKPGRPGNLQGGAIGNAVTITSSRTQDDFTITRQEGDERIVVAGKVVGAQGTPTAVWVNDGTETKKYESIDKVPEPYRAKVKKLLQSGRATGVQFRIGL